MTTSHLEDECPEVKVPCPNGCTEKGILRKDLKLHRYQCPNEVIACSFHEFGCPTELLRKQMHLHETQGIQDHLQLVTTAASELKRKVIALEQRPRKPLMVCKVEGYASLKATGERWLRPDFEPPGDYHVIDVTVWAGRGYLSVEIFVIDCSCDEALPWTVPGHITIELLNQLSNTSHHQVNCELYPCRPAGYTYVARIPEFISHERLESLEDSDCQYLLNDTLYIAITHMEYGTIQ